MAVVPFTPKKVLCRDLRWRWRQPIGVALNDAEPHDRVVVAMWHPQPTPMWDVAAAPIMKHDLLMVSGQLTMRETLGLAHGQVSWWRLLKIAVGLKVGRRKTS